MSTKRKKDRGEPADSRQAQKRRRLVASSAGGTSEAEPVDPRERAVEEVIDLTDKSSEPEVSDLTDDDSVVQWQQSQQHPRFFRAADNSAVLLMSDNEEEQGDYDDIWPAGPASSLIWVDEDSEQQEQSQQYPRFLRAADNPAVLLMSEDEEERRDNDGTWPASLFSSLFWVDEVSEQWQQSQQHPRFFRAADNSAVLLMSDNEEEQGDYDDVWPAGPASSLIWVDEDSELLEEYEQQRRNATLRSQQQSDSSVLSSNEEDEAIDNDVAWSAGAIRCPLCMDSYSEVLQSARLFLSTLCGHVFCSQCLPIALETASACPICRTELTHEQYHPIYI